jgi:(p)ppGpp synthase/HD superfamily hydrolase
MIELAIKFASYYHSGQTRNYTNEPYIQHPLAIAKMIANRTNPFISQTLIPVAILHDVLEDTVATRLQLLEVFGKKIHDMVIELTDSFTADKYPCFNRAERKALECHRIKGISTGSKIIKLCDLIDNTKSIVEHDKDFAVTYLKEKKQLLTVLSSEIKIENDIFPIADVFTKNINLLKELHQEATQVLNEAKQKLNI